MITSEVSKEGAMIMAIWLFQRPDFHDHELFVPAQRASAPTFHAGVRFSARFAPVSGRRRREKSGHPTTVARGLSTGRVV
jgi:hypothetical protein